MRDFPMPAPVPRDPGADDPVDRLRLIRSRRVGAVTYHRLVAEHGSVAAALAALPDVARAAGVEEYSPCPVEVARHEMAQARLAGARMVVPGDGVYPDLLAGLPDAPPVLWLRGDAGLLARPMLAMVGARNASSLGLRMARRLAQGLGAEGQVVVSGLARGIDAEAHEAALPTGTVAVMAGGVDVVYPEENAALAGRIAEAGCLISEQPMGLLPQARHFPLRNRIIAGLARAVVVVEAAARSGSLITARDALDMGREVMAVPGHPFDARAAGCNLLIRDGAVLVRHVEDVMEALGTAPEPAKLEEAEVIDSLPGPVPPRRPLADMAALHGQILARLGPSPVAEDQLIRDLALPAEAVARGLVALEMEGQVRRQAGGMLSRA
ncbi:DNA-protecting protein DprA [Tabrizicola sp. TH137]|uniref:DNA-processing protein DprA n=1 Tax=Tabrizicola sp. TH137 TaxID=2067452 RepID=UPI000C7C56E3|nr:DNA-processing protein DprA [Tabrizicola sp. TH137]PLL12556.1 DNA-protecting protein DprA [Tabrizicola sp. TH137]